MAELSWEVLVYLSKIAFHLIIHYSYSHRGHINLIKDVESPSTRDSWSWNTLAIIIFFCHGNRFANFSLSIFPNQPLITKSPKDYMWVYGWHENRDELLNVLTPIDSLPLLFIASLLLSLSSLLLILQKG
jgi:hypothetical protein